MSQVRSSPRAWRCVLEQETSSSLFSTGSTQKNVPTLLIFFLMGRKALIQTKKQNISVDVKCTDSRPTNNVVSINDDFMTHF